jgi:serine/threonine protein kinase
MTQVGQCPKCGANLSAEASPEGLCPKCLLAAAMADSQTDVTFEETTGSLEPGEQILDKLIGQVLDGKYRLDKKLGQGGMGAVYLATHLGTGRLVAVKVIAPQFMFNEEFVERFKREARAAGLLRHPNVVNVTDFGFATAGSDRLAYLVMEYLNGSTLGDMMKKKDQLPLGLVVDIVEQICLAIGEAHRQGIIHRDLKPDNIWLEPNGRGGYNVKVLDFGLAKLRESSPTAIRAMTGISGQHSISAVTVIQHQQADQDAPTQIQPAMGKERALVEEEKTEAADRGATAGTIEPRTVPEWLTRAGAVLGTPLYMSPEQCRGETLDARSDIYSLGVIIYEMLAGEPPFTGDFNRLVAKHCEMPPPPLREKRRDIPKPVADLVMSALSKNLAGRPTSATTFASALRVKAEDEAAFLRQAITLYNQHFSTFIRLALIGYTPFIAGIAGITVTLLLRSGRSETFANSLFELFIYLLSAIGLFGGLLWAKAVSGGMSVPIVASLLMSAPRSVQLSAIFFAFRKRWRAFLSFVTQRSYSGRGTFFLTQILITLCFSYSKDLFYLSKELAGPAIIVFFSILCSILFIGDSSGFGYYGAVMMVEGHHGKFAAIARSEELRKQLPLVNASFKIFPLLGMIFCFATTLSVVLIWTLIKLFVKGDNLEALAIWGTIILLSIPLSISSIVLIGPLFPIVDALLYLKARQAGGEPISEILDPEFR